ncbi:hypothetical protein GZL_08293 [Streptomyces sp. 769]|nr:hypothetical protein GZL_08293 [Streptomyces sp. 769]
MRKQRLERQFGAILASGPRLFALPSSTLGILDELTAWQSTALAGVADGGYGSSVCLRQELGAQGPPDTVVAGSNGRRIPRLPLDLGSPTSPHHNDVGSLEQHLHHLHHLHRSHQEPHPSQNVTKRR